jgi:hypothetical protein
VVLNTNSTAAIVSAMDVTAKIRKKVSRNAIFFFACKRLVLCSHGRSVLCALSVFSGDLVFMNGESRLVVKCFLLGLLLCVVEYSVRVSVDSQCCYHHHV